MVLSLSGNIDHFFQKSKTLLVWERAAHLYIEQNV